VSEDFDFSTGELSEEMAQYLQMFVDETSDQLDELVEVLLNLETNPNSSSDLNESFRLIHSIKGAAAMMGLESISLLTHHLENHFERLRSGVQTLNRSMMDLILRCVDYLRDANQKLRDGKRLVSSTELLEELSNHESVGSTKTTADPPPPVSAVLEPATSSTQSNDVADLLDKKVIVYFDRDLELPDLKAELILARIRELAQIVRTSPPINEMGSVAELRTLQIWLRTSCSDDKLRVVAEIVGVELVEIDLVIDEDASVSKQPMCALASDGSAPSTRISETPDEPLSNLLTVVEAIDANETPASVVKPAIDPAPESTTAPDTAIQAELASKVAETVRVDIQRLDKLMNLAGELVVNRARFVQLAGQMTETFKKSGLLGRLREVCDSVHQNLPSDRSAPDGDSASIDREDRRIELQSSVDALEEQLQVLEAGRRTFRQLTETIDQLSRISDGIQRSVLDTRMVPVGPLFNRFKRTVRDIAAELDKKVNFVLRGEKTELDKRMIDELGDPLVHLIRNAIDHGLESEAVRRSRGKNEVGTLTLEAVHSGNHVLVFVRDDGGGIDLERVKKRAIERGLATKADVDQMSDKQIAQFIWAIGFSTAESVSDISGRGVGMDIVQTRVRQLNGTIEVDSSFGVGTTFVIRLPLTLAIIRSLLFQLEEGVFAAPIENVREIVSVRSADIISVHGRNSIEVRGDFIPLVDVYDIFDWHNSPNGRSINGHSESENGEDSYRVIIVTSINKTMGLLVSELKGCQDVVVKSLDENFMHIRGLAGASILGDGSVCLLLDISSCIDLAHYRLRNRTQRLTGRLERI
jgi:two-component system chemotaxis sensor kinase CheA